MRELPDDWDAVCLGYHDPRGRVHPSAVASSDEALANESVEVDLIHSTSHCFGLGAWMVSKAAAKELVEKAFPIGSQVDFTLTNYLACHTRRLWKVDPTNLLFYAPSSEEEMDSDVQTMIPIDKIEEEHKSLQKYINYMNGRTNDYDEYYAELFGLDDDEDHETYEEAWMREWQESRNQDYYGDGNKHEDDLPVDTPTPTSSLDDQ
eukprot:TRINITY_DN15101_c1_g2_i1.p1 TRINITY_DN15101_c1_g2~~TRINITY_DN15101_c1_g2_i1.p1  ORF type:complete len:206 (+),score=42.46 TRINITY_DN15101_c1_g2_i1:508-1125(+)